MEVPLLFFLNALKNGGSLSLLAFFFAAFQLLAPVFFTELLDIRFRAIHVVFVLSIVFITFISKKKQIDGRYFFASLFFNIFCILLLFAANANIYMKALDVYTGMNGPGASDFFWGVILFLLILEAARRSVGTAIPLLVLLLIGYVLAGDFFPGIWKLRGISFKYAIDSLYFSPLGIYGSVTGMSATFIAMFILFGALLSATGGGKTFIDIALALTGRFSGGPAKAAVVSSALFGSISGSSVANVMVTGSYTIPLMKRIGYTPEFAAAVEAIASSGGGITPPIMSISAFMMAEFLGIPYFHIIGYALLPCILYYTGVFSGIHFRTISMGIARLPEEEIPTWRSILTLERLSGLLIPTFVLLYYIAAGQPLQLAGFYACTSALLIFLLLGVLKGELKQSLWLIADALVDGGLGLAKIAPILISVSMLVNLIGLTGLAPKISGVILELGGSNIYLSLLIATLVPFLLGTSLPVVPTYVLSVSILVPPLLKLGFDPVAAHLFFIYWAILGGVTPPTCTTAVAAAGIAQADWLKTGFLSVRLGAVAFMLPYFFVLNSALVGRASIDSILVHALTGLIGAVCIAYGLFSRRSKASWYFLLRFVFLVGGVLLLFPKTFFSIVGLLLVGLAFYFNRHVINSMKVGE